MPGPGMKLLVWPSRLGRLVRYHCRPPHYHSNGGRLVFALAGIAVTLVGVLGVLPIAFGKSMAGKAEPSVLQPKPLWSIHDEKNPSI